PNEPSARFDSGVESGSVVSVDFDPMLAKVVVHAPTRTEAAQRLALVLERMVIAGVVTNRDFLVSTLRSAEFLAGDTHTDFITKVAPATRFAPSNEQMTQALAVAVLCRQAHNRAEAPQLSFMRSGYRNSIMPPQEIRFASDERELPVAYRSLRDGDFDIWVNDVPTDRAIPVRARLVDCRGTQIVAEIDGLRSTYDVIRSGVGHANIQWLVQGPWGAIEVTELPRFPEIGREGVAGGQVAPMPGAIRVVAVAVGDLVRPGQTLVVMEAMKMEHTIAAPTAAVVSEVRCEVGDQVDNGQVLIVLQESDN
ncbi:MAG: propionyl-CoA carboxylase alpha chain, partial [Acidimicrobiales bacterium]